MEFENNMKIEDILCQISSLYKKAIIYSEENIIVLEEEDKIEGNLKIVKIENKYGIDIFYFSKDNSQKIYTIFGLENAKKYLKYKDIEYKKEKIKIIDEDLIIEIEKIIF